MNSWRLCDKLMRLRDELMRLCDELMRLCDETMLLWYDKTFVRRKPNFE